MCSLDFFGRNQISVRCVLCLGTGGAPWKAAGLKAGIFRCALSVAWWTIRMPSSAVFFVHRHKLKLFWKCYFVGLSVPLMITRVRPQLCYIWLHMYVLYYTSLHMTRAALYTNMWYIWLYIATCIMGPKAGVLMIFTLRRSWGIKGWKRWNHVREGVLMWVLWYSN